MIQNGDDNMFLPRFSDHEWSFCQYYLVVEDENGCPYFYAESKEPFPQEKINQFKKADQENGWKNPQIIEVYNKKEFLSKTPID